MTTFADFNTSGLSAGDPWEQRVYINDNGQAVSPRYTGTVNGQRRYAETPVHRVNVNATLPRRAWIDMDQRIITAMQSQLAVVADLEQLGLVYNAGGLGTMSVETQGQSSLGDADVSMTGVERKRDGLAYTYASTPIPIISHATTIMARALEASRRTGQALDLAFASEAGRSIARRLESIVVNGATVGTVNSDGSTGTVYGLTTFPSRQTKTLSDWSASATSAATIFKEVAEMRAQLLGQRAYGPYTLYVNSAVEARLDEQYASGTDTTIRQKLTNLAWIRDVKFSAAIGDNDALLVDMKDTYVRLARAVDVTTIEEAGNAMQVNLFTYTAAAPLLTTDGDGLSGICHGSWS